MFSRNYKARTENRNEFLIDSIKVSVENWATDEYTLIHVPQNSFNYNSDKFQNCDVTDFCL